MIRINDATDLNWINLYRVAYQRAALEIDPALSDRIDAGARQFAALIERGVPCYGVTTGLGQLVGTELGDHDRAALQANLLRARAAAIGPPLIKPVARAMLFLRLVNFVSGRAGVSSALCQALVDCLNRDLVPWVPQLGHGMAADAIANTHAFQILIGEGFVYAADGGREPAEQALRRLRAEPIVLRGREGLALVNGICASPALAMDAYYQLDRLLRLAHLVAAVSIEGLAAPRDAVDPVVAELSSEAATGKVIEALRKHLDHSQIEAHRLQAPVSYRILPQVHGALFEALARLREKIEFCLRDNSDNPLMQGERLLSVGSFHNPYLVNQVEQVALALAHVGCLSERRLHRLLDPALTGLSPQLAARPGLDAGLVVAHKASVDLAARLRMLAQPLSLYTAETSAGQEDYMSLALPALTRLFEMAQLVRSMFAYELLAGLTAVRLRGQTPGDGVKAIAVYFDDLITLGERDRPPGPEVETILQQFESDAFDDLLA